MPKLHRAFAKAILTFAIIALASMAAPDISQARGVCWTPAELAGQTGEAEITKNVPEAYRPIPREARLAPPPLSDSHRGVIRRVTVPAGMKVVALTFDLCEQPYEISGYQGDIVDYLRAEGIAATFFASGKWLVTHPVRAEQLIADPLFEVANHAWEHRNFHVLAEDRMMTEIAGAQLAFRYTHRRLMQRACLREGANGARVAATPVPRNFRFPFGACRPEAVDAVNAEGLRVIQWDVSSADPWRGQTVDRMVTAVVSRVRPGSIVLFHANGRGWKTGEALPIIISKLRAEGYRFVTTEHLLALGTPEIAETCFNERPGDSERYGDLAQRLERAYDAFYARFGGERPRLPDGD